MNILKHKTIIDEASSYSAKLPRLNILDVKVNAINMSQSVETIDSWIARQEQNYVCITGFHGIMICQKDSDLLRIHNTSGLTTPDGMSIVWILQSKGYHSVSRVYGPDLMLAVCEHSAHGGNYRHFMYGGLPGVAEQLANVLTTRFPGLQVVGTYSPPFRPLTLEEDQNIIEKIDATNPDIIWIGIGTPKQERWMSAHMGRVNASVMIGVGAAFDFLSGHKKQAPYWMQRHGMEWFFRLMAEPRRLWRRYIKLPYFAWLLFAQTLGIRHYPED